MINKAEIEAKSIEFEIHSSNVERDYVFGLLLFGIFTISGLKDRIFLKGGNALRKGYFENTRFSNDLDFGIPDDITQDALIAEINTVCDFIQLKSGITFIKENTKVEEKFTATDAPLPDLKVYEVRVYFNGFNGEADHIKLKISMDVTRFDKVLLPIQSVKLIHPYSDANEITCNIQCMKLEEIIATKLKCILQRQHAPDLFDYVYSIKLLGGNLDKEEVIETFIQKTIFKKNPYILKGILNKTPFDYFRMEWVKSVICAKQYLMSVEDAISAFISDLEALFVRYPDNGYAQFAYFNADLRIPIMQAGRTQTLLKIIYKGEERLVEPYSLKYQQRRDGVEREYFFAHKLSGGKSEPGTKRFVAEHMSFIENTDTKFIPRHQIELSKAGETPENRYLFDPNKPMRSPSPRRIGLTRTSRTSSFGQPKYIYQCNYCGKKFPKSTRDSNIRKHKDKSGYPCSGRRGYYIDMKY